MSGLSSNNNGFSPNWARSLLWKPKIVKTSTVKVKTPRSEFFLIFDYLVKLGTKIIIPFCCMGRLESDTVCLTKRNISCSSNWVYNVLSVLPIQFKETLSKDYTRITILTCGENNSLRTSELILYCGRDLYSKRPIQWKCPTPPIWEFFLSNHQTSWKSLQKRHLLME